jgi:hypothetical protein
MGFPQALLLCLILSIAYGPHQLGCENAGLRYYWIWSLLRPAKVMIAIFCEAVFAPQILRTTH